MKQFRGQTAAKGRNGFTDPSKNLMCADACTCLCARGDTSIMKLLLDKVQVDPNAQHGRELHSALHVAAKAGELSNGVTS